MGTVFSDPHKKKEYYRDQAQKLRFDSRQARKADDPIEAARLEKLANEAENAAQAQEEQIQDIVDKITH